MAKKTTKAAKKFQMKRGEISATLNNVLETISDVDTFIMTPEDVSTLIDEVRDALEALAQDVEAEAY